MNNKPDVVFLLAGIVAVGALVTGLLAPDQAQAVMVVSESLIR